MVPIHVMSHPYASAYFTALTLTFGFEGTSVVMRRKIRHGLALLAFNFF
jgi:hypothetical protein